MSTPTWKEERAGKITNAGTRTTALMQNCINELQKVFLETMEFDRKKIDELEDGLNKRDDLLVISEDLIKEKEAEIKEKDRKIKRLVKKEPEDIERLIRGLKDDKIQIEALKSQLESEKAAHLKKVEEIYQKISPLESLIKTLEETHKKELEQLKVELEDARNINKDFQLVLKTRQENTAKFSIERQHLNEINKELRLSLEKKTFDYESLKGMNLLLQHENVIIKSKKRKNKEEGGEDQKKRGRTKIIKCETHRRMKKKCPEECPWRQFIQKEEEQ